MKKKIIILGGGTSGWLSAAYLVKNLKVPSEIILIEDTSTTPIGVGEGTQPYTTRFLHDCGIEPSMWMKDSSASFKLGVELVDWNKNPYFVDNDTAINHIARSNLYSFDYFINKPTNEFTEWHPLYRLAKANKSPKLVDGEDFNFNLPNGSYGAVHFDALKIIKTIKNLILDKITYINTKITGINSGEMGIVSINSNTDSYRADTYIDCTGFKSLLLGTTLGIDFIDYSKYLPCDKAVAIQTQYTDPVTECFPYTKSIAMDAGWRWQIPTYSRVGNGYVYSSKFTTDAQAELELRKAINEHKASARVLSFKCGRYAKIAYKNVCAVGLSAGFIEPLEATGITFTTTVIKDITDSLNYGYSGDYINSRFHYMVVEILAFVWAHYHFSTRCGTPFWDFIRSQSISDLPEEAQKVLSNYYPKLTRSVVLNNNSMFNNFHWFSVLHQTKNANSELIKESELKYLDFFIKVQSAKIDLILKEFPNNYEYLSKYYNK